VLVIGRGVFAHATRLFDLGRPICALFIRKTNGTDPGRELHVAFGDDAAGASGTTIPRNVDDRIAVAGLPESGVVASVHYRGGVARSTNFYGAGGRCWRQGWHASFISSMGGVLDRRW
jgi:hypothetical protein